MEQRLLIADSSEEFCLALTQALRDQFPIRHCLDGHSALRELRTGTYSLLVLNMMLPELDGITLLERLRAENITPTVLALTPIQSGYILEASLRLGVSYLVMKPCDITATAARICDLGRIAAPTVPKQDAESCLEELLRSLSIRSRHLGARCLYQTILLTFRHPDFVSTKEFYPEAAALCQCKVTHVERNIRTALDAAWKQRDEALWRRYFPTHTTRPTNTEFIFRMAEELRQRQRQGLVEERKSQQEM